MRILSVGIVRARDDSCNNAPRWPGCRSWLTEGAGSVYQRLDRPRTGGYCLASSSFDRTGGEYARRQGGGYVGAGPAIWGYGLEELQRRACTEWDYIRTASVRSSISKQRRVTATRSNEPSSSFAPYLGAFIEVTRFGATSVSHALLRCFRFLGIEYAEGSSSEVVYQREARHVCKPVTDVDHVSERDAPVVFFYLLVYRIGASIVADALIDCVEVFRFLGKRDDVLDVPDLVAIFGKLATPYSQSCTGLSGFP